MRRKRLQHAADTMCQMFCGWRLIESKPNLLKLGSGTLEIDAITGQCVFQRKTTVQLTIAEEIRAWLQQDLATNKIPIAALTGAHLAVKLSFSVVPWNECTREISPTGGPVSLVTSPRVRSPKQVWIGPSSSHVVCLRPRLSSCCSRSGSSMNPVPLNVPNEVSNQNAPLNILANISS